MEMAGFFQIRVLANFIGLSFNEVEDKIQETLKEFNTAGVSDDELARTKMSYKSYLVDQANSIQSKATLLSGWNIDKGNGFNLNDEIARYENVTKEDIMRVFRKYILNKKAVIITVSREVTKDGDDEISKSVNPYAGMKKEVDPIRIPNIFFKILNIINPSTPYEQCI